MASDEDIKEKEIKFVQIIVRLGMTQTFEIAADERVKVKPSEAVFFASNVGGSVNELLLDILAKVSAAFESEEASITLKVKGEEIVLDEE